MFQIHHLVYVWLHERSGVISETHYKHYTGMLLFTVILSKHLRSEAKVCTLKRIKQQQNYGDLPKHTT